MSDIAFRHYRQRAIRWHWLRWLLSGLGLVVLVCATATVGQAQQDERCFAETGYCIQGRIRDYWEQNGGLSVFGFPLTPQQEGFVEGKTYQVQWFERARLELHPDKAPPYDVLLGRLGDECLQQQGRDWYTFEREPLQDGCLFFEQTGHSVCGDFQAMWTSNGLEFDQNPATTTYEESLALFGKPLSGPQREILSDGNEYLVQWFERVRFELHPENDSPYHVLLGSVSNCVMPQGHIVFSSERDGNKEIYMMNANGTDLVNLTNHPSEDMFPALSPDGNKIAFSSNRGGNYNIYVMDRDGSNVSLLVDNAAFDWTPVWSPDGSKIAFVSTVMEGNNEIYVMNADGSNMVRLTNHPRNDWWPTWSPSGGFIAFTSERDDNAEIYVMRADGSDVTNLSRSPDSHDSNPDWSPDGNTIAFVSNRDRDPHLDDAINHIYLMHADGSEQTRLTSHNRYDEFPSWSPDGRWVAFMSERDNNFEIYIVEWDSGKHIRLTDEAAADVWPSWGR